MQALATVDDAKRQELLAKASELAMADVGLIPSHYQINTWAVPQGPEVYRAGRRVYA